MAWQDNTELATLHERLEARAAELREEVAAVRAEEAGDIPLARLQVQPAAARCAACQERVERG